MAIGMCNNVDLCIVDSYNVLCLIISNVFKLVFVLLVPGPPLVCLMPYLIHNCVILTQ